MRAVTWILPALLGCPGLLAAQSKRCSEDTECGPGMLCSPVSAAPVPEGAPSGSMADSSQWSGVCAPEGTGDPCEANQDCAEGLLCVTGVCAPREAMIGNPAAGSAPDAGELSVAGPSPDGAETARGEDCSISSRQEGGSALIWAAAMLFLIARRVCARA